MPLNTQGGKKKPFKAPRKDGRDETEEDKVFKQQKANESKALEAARKTALAKSKPKK